MAGRTCVRGRKLETRIGVLRIGIAVPRGGASSPVDGGTPHTPTRLDSCGRTAGTRARARRSGRRANRDARPRSADRLVAGGPARRQNQRQRFDFRRATPPVTGSPSQGERSPASNYFCNRFRRACSNVDPRAGNDPKPADQPTASRETTNCAPFLRYASSTASESSCSLKHPVMVCPANSKS